MNKNYRKTITQTFNFLLKDGQLYILASDVANMFSITGDDDNATLIRDLIKKQEAT